MAVCLGGEFRRPSIAVYRPNDFKESFFKIEVGLLRKKCILKYEKKVFRVSSMCVPINDPSLVSEFKEITKPVYWEVGNTEAAKLRRALVIQNEAVPSKYVYRLLPTWQERQSTFSL